MNTVAFLNPEQVLANLELRENMRAAEFGCGAGKFVLLLAKKLNEGRVYGIDIQTEPLSVLKSRAQADKVFNIETIQGDLEQDKGSTLPDNFLDFVLIPNLLFQVENQKAIMNEAKRILKSSGEILVIDWNPEGSFGPSKQERIPANNVKAIAEELSLKLKKEFEAGNFHYGLVFSKL